MKEAKKAVFDFESFKISKFFFIEVPRENLNPIVMGFSPSGVFYEKNKKFELKIEFSAKPEGSNNEDDSEIINVLMTTFFSFDENITLETIPVYFYRNALAIVFPYLRSFISTMTFQANIKPIILPILNLSGLEEPLRENISTVLD